MVGALRTSSTACGGFWYGCAPNRRHAGRYNSSEALVTGFIGLGKSYGNAGLKSNRRIPSKSSPASQLHAPDSPDAVELRRFIRAIAVASESRSSSSVDSSLLLRSVLGLGQSP